MDEELNKNAIETEICGHEEQLRHYVKLLAAANETARLTKATLAGFKKITDQLNDTVSGLQGEISRFTVQ